MTLHSFLFLAGILLSSTTVSLGELATCGLTQKDGINTFTIRTASPNGEIPLMHMQFDTRRKLAVTSTVLHDQMNLVQNVDRVDNFRTVECEQLSQEQQNCDATMRLSVPQKEKINAEYNSWDRGHMTPVNPMRFSAEAVNATYYCVNIAPQEPWSNQCAWYAVEERTLSSAKNFSGYVMTGLCAADNVVDGDTYYGLKVPDCFWKMTCYVDPDTKKTHVVAFIQDNKLIPYESRAEGRQARSESTTRPRAQQEVLDLMGVQTKYINSAWRAAQNILTEGRDSGTLPRAETCIRAKTIPDDVVAQWNVWMGKHRPMPNCNKLKAL